ncbi:hypothetical protein LTR17_019486 [Elasticomyces elasticus]|nr:hypothetical protein LTR17_019486 [Elasticomyces elasticus]
MDNCGMGVVAVATGFQALLDLIDIAGRASRDTSRSCSIADANESGSLGDASSTTIQDDSFIRDTLDVDLDMADGDTDLHNDPVDLTDAVCTLGGATAAHHRSIVLMKNGPVIDFATVVRKKTAACNMNCATSQRVSRLQMQAMIHFGFKVFGLEGMASLQTFVTSVELLGLAAPLHDTGPDAALDVESALDTAQRHGKSLVLRLSRQVYDAVMTDMKLARWFDEYNDLAMPDTKQCMKGIKDGFLENDSGMKNEPYRQ